MADGYWTELSLRVAPEACEATADLLQELTGNGVTIEPPIEALGPDEGYVLDEVAPMRLLAYVYGPVSGSRRATIRRQIVAAGLGEAIAGRLGWQMIREEDWAEAWKEHYDIERVGRLVVRPAWREYTAAPGEIVVSLDPGMAFGTGQHPTTRMCMAALQEEGHQAPGNSQRGSRKEQGGPGRVLDLGSGSGILAIAAIAMGAEWVLAIDTEEQAVEASISNAALNGMQDRITVRGGSIEAVAGDGPFDCILANINAAAVSSLAQAMADEMKPGAWLSAGGVIAEKEAGARAAIEAAGLGIERVMQDGDWRTFVARKQ
ncbi:MAG TPA: 50S ribosomal protein L11 methyltransferase [Dehalococcoidia bacterium]|nr:50S ribosomal protein L11 methyltransferase [Dehalococcoidia bacterium]